MSTTYINTYHITKHEKLAVLLGYCGMPTLLMFCVDSYLLMRLSVVWIYSRSLR
jgi:hypothetical protein